MADEIVWGEPPPAGRGSGRQSMWPARAEELRKRPRKWARFGPYNSYAAATSGPRRNLGPEFEYRGRLIDGKFWVYVRYVPSGVKAAAS